MSLKYSSILQLRLSGWGKYPIVKSLIQRPEKVSSIAEIIQKSSDKTLLARGAGHSIGDAALNGEGYTVLIVYFPWFWFWIMLIIRSIPESLFKWLKL